MTSFAQDRSGFLGIDVGTTAAKVGVLTNDGNLFYVVEKSYPLHQPSANQQELDPQQVLKAIKDSVHKASEACTEGRVAIQGISFSILGEAFLLADQEGAPISQSPVAMDQRGVAKLGWFRAHFGTDAIHAHTGQPLHSMYTATKLAWWRDEAAEQLRQAHKIVDWQAFLTWWMCGAAVTDASLATRTLLYDIHQATWWDDMVRALPITQDQLPSIMHPGTVAGTLQASAAEVLALPKGIPVVTGSWDQACAGLAGNVQDTVLLDSLGTTQALVLMAPEALDIGQLCRLGYQVTPSATPGKRVVVGGSLSGALILRWLIEQLAVLNPDGEGASYQDLLAMIARAPGRLFVLPHLTGAGTPRLDPTSMAAIVGIRYGTRLADIVAAALDGIAYEARMNVEALREQGIVIESVHATGGLSQFKPYLERKADVYGLHVRSLRYAHGSVLGAAMLAAKGVGDHETFRLAGSQALSSEEVVPDSHWVTEHTRRFHAYKTLHPALNKAFEVLQT